MSETPFLESNALLALIQGDESEAERIVKEMLPGELDDLARACDTLRWMAREEAGLQRERERWSS